jgi:CheY-like chemotaxis protein
MSEEQTIRIVMAEDSAVDAELARYALRRARIPVQIVLAATEAEFREALVSLRPHIIVSDNSMPQFSGAEALAIARAISPDAPFIFLSGTLAPGSRGSDLLIRADACLDKSELDRLGALINDLLQKRGWQWQPS